MSWRAGSSYRGLGYPKATTDMDWPEENALWVYTPLPESLALNELQRLAFARSFNDTDAVSFQPCPSIEDRSQDRYVVQDWSIGNNRWTFRAVFDGHAGHDCVDYAQAELPGLIFNRLSHAVEETPDYTPDTVRDIISRAISDFDAGIGQKLLELFPDPVALGDMYSGDVEDIINDDGPNSEIVLRCMRGSTALISITDLEKKNMWVASLGDCAAVLGTRDASTGAWNASVLSTSHNGDNNAEVERVRREHPGEPEAIMNGRVLGAIAVTRALGDFAFKLPKVYTLKVFLNSKPAFSTVQKVRDFISRSITPPYMNAVPDIRHVDLSTYDLENTFLVMCSDGLTDLSPDRLNLERLAQHWVNIVSRRFQYDENLAMALLRDAVGGDDINKISRMITVEMSSRWMDDTTVLVQRFHG